MLRRQRSGAIVCPSCGKLVGVNDETCWSCGRRRPGMYGFAGALRGLGSDMGFEKLVIGASIALFAATLVASGGGLMRGGGLFGLLAPSPQSLFAFGASGAVPVFGYGRWWTVLSAGWLHGGLLHILFNMLWVRQLAPATAQLYGPGRMVILYTISSITGFLLSSTMGALLPGVPILGGARLTVGASAPIFGLLGALVHYGRRGGSSAVGSQAWTYAVVLFIFGFVMRGVDNWAHLGGFLGGYLGARWLDPMKPERGDHLIGAVVCLVATALAVVASFVTAL